LISRKGRGENLFKKRRQIGGSGIAADFSKDVKIKSAGGNISG
jgi:hypothetical protein